MFTTSSKAFGLVQSLKLCKYCVSEDEHEEHQVNSVDEITSAVTDLLDIDKVDITIYQNSFVCMK